MVADLVQFLGHVSHVTTEPLIEFSDIEIWNHSASNSLTIITKDSDFLHYSTLRGCPPKVIRLKCGNKTTDFICDLLKNNALAINAFVTVIMIAIWRYYRLYLCKDMTMAL